MASLSSAIHHHDHDKPSELKHSPGKAAERKNERESPRHHHTPSAEPGSTTDEAHSRREDPHIPAFGGSHHFQIHHPHPSFPPVPYLWDPRLDPRFAAMEGRLAYNPPIPLNARTHEGRYHFEPYMHHPTHGYTPGGSPVMSDISMIRMSPQRSGLTSIPESPVYPYYMPPGYIDHLHGSPAISVLSHARGLSPTGSHHGYDSHRGTPGRAISHVPYSQHGLPGDLLTQPPSTAGSIEHPALDFGSVEGSRFSSPKPGGRLSRKRALSISPLSGSFDIDAMIRNSPNSLVAYMNNSRSSSAASGSYGHLSAGTVSPLSWHHSVTPLAHLQHLQQQLMRHRGVFYPPHPPGVLPPPPPSHHHHHHPTNPAMAHLIARAHGHPEDGPTPIKKMEDTLDREHPKEPNNNLVSSSADLERKRAIAEGMEEGPSLESATVSSTSHVERDSMVLDREDDGNKDKEEDIPAVTDCEWLKCTRKFHTLDQLVQHINNEHIHTERKEFVCRWRDCIREEKPFKAQYMLVVHMRRHTGEKPHKCTFEGCAKAYSRLENLKTHLRSHTGERPYVCEFQGCTKAFSNASDRAKHQNRTHSNAKPYVCKIAGCTKRYTDPSSLRKHVKTVHGPEAHVTKKMRGDKRDPGSGPKKEEKDPGDVGGKINGGIMISKSERSPVTMKVEDDRGQSCEQMMSPKVKADELSIQSCGAGTVQEYSTSPHNDSGVEVEMNTSTDDDKIQDDQISSNMGPPTEVHHGGSGSVSTASQAVRANSPFMVKAPKTKSRSSAVTRLAQKVTSIQPLPQLPPINTKRVSEGPDYKPKDRTIEKLQFEEKCDSSQSFFGNQDTTGNRRGSNSTVSSYFSSRRSSEASPFPALGYSTNFSSRRSSQGSSSYFSSRRTSGASSQFSNRMGVVSSPYDYISVDGSRRSSDASSLTGPTGLPGLTLQDQRRLQAKYDQVVGRQHNWGVDDRMGPSPSPVPPRAAPYRRVSGAASLPPRTPLPHEVPGNELRRASDPVKMGYMDEMHRRNSLNNVAPLPMPHNMRSMHPGMGMRTVHEGIPMQGTGYDDNPNVNNLHGSWGNVAENTPQSNSFYRNGGMPGVNVGGQDELVLPDEMVQYLQDQRQQGIHHQLPQHQQSQHVNVAQPVHPPNIGNHGYNSMGSRGYPGGNPNMTGVMERQAQQHNLNMITDSRNIMNNNNQFHAQNTHLAQNNNLAVPAQPLPMEMSPDCNQVTSTVDNDCGDAMARGLANLSEDGMDHVQPLVPDAVIEGNNPTRELEDPNPNISNMVVNDMSSMLTSLAEENKYLNLM